MTTGTAVTLSLSILGLLLSIVALSAALRSSGRSLLRRFNALSERFLEIETALESQQGRMKSLSVRMSNATRSKSANGDVREPSAPMTELEKDQWQREMNRELALKRLR